MKKEKQFKVGAFVNEKVYEKIRLLAYQKRTSMAKLIHEVIVDKFKSGD